MKKKVFTVATAHLDTSWLWTQEETIKTYIPRTLKYNFDLFKKYPTYKFNFEGSYRYELMEEYYPDEFNRLKEYINSGNWNVCGSCYENGDSNIPSPESLIRNIIYGNGFFKEKFGVVSNDIYLPDSFGFGKALPSVASHCGLIGFSTQKLTWGCSSEVPHEFGKWVGLDGKGLYTSIKPGSYGTVLGDLRNEYTNSKLDANKKIGFDYTMYYHGTGDRGGSPSPKSVDSVVKQSLLNDSSDIEIESSSICDVFKTIDSLDEKIKKKIPVWEGEYLMTEHGTGSYTTRCASKRLNKQAEVLADACERASVISSVYTGSLYNQTRIDKAWKKVIQHQFHDDITGTSFQECYKRNWNDYLIALNIFSNELETSLKEVSKQFNTLNTTYPVIVFNPSSYESKEACCIKLPRGNYKVVDYNNNNVLYQQRNDKDYSYITFIPCVKGNSITLFNVIISKDKNVESSLSFGKNTLVNDKYIITFNSNYDICSIIDKTLDAEILKAPITLSIIKDTYSINWPAWEVKYEDYSIEKVGIAKGISLKVIENGPALIKLEVLKEYNTSKFKQIITLTALSNRIDVYNEVDWREEASDLMVDFPMSFNNKMANYDVGLGKFSRPTNTPKQYCVPAQRFAEMDNIDVGYTVSVLSDSKTAWDKPSDNTIRLTCIHTPIANYRWETSQHLADIGLNFFSYSIVSHKTVDDIAVIEADKFVKGLKTYLTNKQDGTIIGELSLVDVPSDIHTLSIKKAQDNNDLILRFVDFNGTSPKKVAIKFNNKISKAYLVNGMEEVISEINVKSNTINLDFEKYELKSIRICYKNNEVANDSEELVIPYNHIGITDNFTRENSTTHNGISLPKELLSEYIISSGIKYHINTNVLENNIYIPHGESFIFGNLFNKAHILCASLSTDHDVVINNQRFNLPKYNEEIGYYDLVGLGLTGYIKHDKLGITLSHHHNTSGDLYGKQAHFFVLDVDCLNGELNMPDDNNMMILSISLTYDKCVFVRQSTDYDTLNKSKYDYVFSKYAAKRMKEPFIEKVMDIFFNRIKSYELMFNKNYTTQSFADGYSLFDLSYNKKLRKKLDEKENNK